MSRKTTVTHPDGTISTHKSQTKHYTHAVEVTCDNHAKAARLRREALDQAIKAEQYRDALSVGFYRVTAKRWGYEGEARYLSFFLIDAATGDELYVGHEIRNTDGTFYKYYSGGELDIPTEALASARIYLSNAASLRRQADELTEGPRIAYSVWRWSESQQAAESYARSLRNKGHDARVVQADES
ncbi:hypothetical protein [Kribbella deserti]|uniref:Uncharacterized protein n=1 Tax=Kribbella deserti TaxID=1926257 RepID=A0ABV6QGM1_9ACTN